MIENGFIEEVRGLLFEYSGKISKDYKSNIADYQALQSVGYKELKDYLNDKMTRAEAIERIKIATRQYAKRQITWFRKDKRIHWVKNEQEAEKLVKDFLS